MKISRLFLVFVCAALFAGSFCSTAGYAASGKKSVEVTVKTVNGGQEVEIIVDKYSGAVSYKIYLCGRENDYSPYLVCKDKEVSYELAELEAGSGKVKYTVKGLTKGKYTFMVEAYAAEYNLLATSEKKTANIKAVSVQDRREQTYDFSKTKIGEVITFGAYEQDGDFSNGKEPIEWIVLSKDKNEMLVLSKYELDYLPFYTREYYGEDERDTCFVTWDKSTIRTFLNDGFYNAAFTSGEKKLVKTASLKTTVDFSWRSKETKTTKDNVFLLSSDDLAKTAYGFAKDKDTKDSYRRSSLTAYAAYQRALNKSSHWIIFSDYKTDDNEYAWEWALRDPGFEEQFICYVGEDGRVSSWGGYAGTHYKHGFGYGIRPAILIDMSSFKITNVESLLDDVAAANKKKLKINKKSFPDAVFREYIRDVADNNEDGWLSQREMDSVEKLSFFANKSKYDAEKNSLKGIENFKNLRELQVFYANLKSVDLSANTKLQSVEIDLIGKTKSINLEGCGALTNLWVYSSSSKGSLSKINLTDCNALERISVKGLKLKALDVSGKTALKELYCYENQISSLNLKDCVLLTDLDCASNKLKNLDASKCADLVYLACYNNQLTSLKFGKNLVDLDCSGNMLNNLDISKLTSLETLKYANNKLPELHKDISSTALKVLDCSGNGISSIDVSIFKGLTNLDVSSNQLTELDVTKNTLLNKLICSKNLIEELDIRKNKVLDELYCSGNRLSTLNLSGNEMISRIDCSANLIEELDVSRNSKLSDLRCSDNKIKELDLRKCSEYIWCVCDDDTYIMLTDYTGYYADYKYDR